jgi:hypothetical protein
MRFAIPDASRATPNGVPVNKGPHLRADRPALTADERLHCLTARAEGEYDPVTGAVVETLLAIIERLTGERP